MGEPLRLTGQAQLKAFSHPLRVRIIARVGQQPATVAVLAEELGRPPGTIGHHTKVLEEAGLLHVVRTREVHGITERWLGRTAATFELPDEIDDERKGGWMLQEFGRAQSNAVAAGAIDDGVLTLRLARIPAARAAEWRERLIALAEEFAAEEPGGGTTHTLLLGLAPATGLGDEA